MNFDSFFEAIHGYGPFPWQRRAAERLMAGEPLEAVTVPTGSGKTAMIDAALFHAAHGGPRRIFFIIDRRVVVDEAHERAQRIRTALETSPELAEFRQKLGEIQVIRLRGGVQGEDDWVWNPEKITLVLSTVDQVGSRLLHRGYGVSPRMWPVHAGMVGNQALYLVDEAHLSRPFARTVQTVREQGADIRLIQLSATLGETHGATLGLDPEDLAHPVLQKRLRTSKEAWLDIVPDADNQFASRATEKAESFLDHPMEDAPVIGIVVNRVKSARAVWQALRKRKHEALLLIGPIRPFDRDRLMAEWLPQIHTGRARNREAPMFVVATQTIEVGADLDFDALITEAAPLSALRQRFGRLDRLGLKGYAPAWILGREGQLDPKKADKAPVYGEDIFNTWEWLNAVLSEEEIVDFGLHNFEAVCYGNPLPAERNPHCPPLLPIHIDVLSQTGPDAPPFDPAPWLHGPQRRSNEVNVVWRADLHEAYMDHWAELVDLFPPNAREAVQVPITALRDLLASKRGADIYDIEGGDAEETQRPAELRPFVAWSDAEESWQLHRLDGSALRLRPGTTVVLPSAYGGHDEFGWDLGFQKPVADIAESCALETDRAFSLRLSPALNNRLTQDPARLEALDDALGGYRKTLEDPDDSLDRDLVSAAENRLRDTLSKIRHPFVERLGRQYSITLTPPGALLTQRRLQDLAGSITGGVAVGLMPHIEGVANTVEALAADDPERERIERAAKAHDLGKQAPQFQALLYGDKVRAAAGPLLAKSGLRSPRALRNALKHSGYPRGFRHELHSLDLMLDADPLVRYLVATHHGHGRPWFPACADPQAPGAEHAQLDARWARAFAELRKAFGPWRLAGLEQLLRSADIRRSIAEQTDPKRADAEKEGDDA